MKSQTLTFSNIVETIYNLPLNEKLEIKQLLEHNIAESRRNSIVKNYKTAHEEYNEKKLVFSSKIDDLKKMI